MEIKYEITGKARKAFAKAVGEITGATPKYLGAPTFAYKVEPEYVITRDGNLDVSDKADSREVKNLIEMLAEKGFIGAEMPAGLLENVTAEVITEDITEPQSENTGLTVALPIESVSVENLTRLLDAKGSLIKKALVLETLPVEVSGDRVSFPWFQETDAEEAAAYTHFISALCEMSRKQKRITATEKTVDNEKYAFRCFLLRLGFIGAEYKNERKILLRNLSGSSAFRKGNIKVSE